MLPVPESGPDCLDCLDRDYLDQGQDSDQGSDQDSDLGLGLGSQKDLVVISV